MFNLSCWQGHHGYRGPNYIIPKFLDSYGGFLSHGGTPQWMVFRMVWTCFCQHFCSFEIDESRGFAYFPKPPVKDDLPKTGALNQQSQRWTENLIGPLLQFQASTKRQTMHFNHACENAHICTWYGSIVNAIPVFLNLLIYQWCIVANISSFGESACDRGSSGCLTEWTNRAPLPRPACDWTLGEGHGENTWKMQ